MNKPFSPIGLYRHGITDPEQLIATTVSRQHLVDDLLGKLRRRVRKKSGQNHLFIGPRGIGKTHLLSLLQCGIETDSKLHKHYHILRFPEESNRILSFADLLLGIVELLSADENDTQQQVQWQRLHREIETEDDDQRLIDQVLPRLKQWHRQTGKVLILMLENLDILFTEQIRKKQDIHRIRGLLMDNSHILLISTAPVFFPGLNDVKHPLYDFFDIQIIDELDQKQTLALIKVQLEWDQHHNILKQLSQLRPRILAMHTLTGGNPRLIMMLYELIAQENLTEIKTQFQQLLDRITPFYQDRLKELPPQERALLETIALMRTQRRTPVNIAARFRKPRHQTSTLLKRMTEAGYLSVSPNPSDKRSRLYRIKEGFFDIWLAMHQSRAQRKYLPYLVEFFTLWYANVEEREMKRQQLAATLAELEQKEQKNAFEMLAYLSEATEQKDEKYQSKIRLAVEQLKLGLSQQAKTTLKETLVIEKKPRGLMAWMYDTTNRWSEGQAPESALQYMEKIISYWQEQRAGDLENTAWRFNELSLDFSSHGLHQLHIALLRDKLIAEQSSEEKINILLRIASSEKCNGQLRVAIETLNHALKLARSTESRLLEGRALNNISQIFKARGDYETALSYLKQSLSIMQEIGDKSGEGTTLNNISQIYDARGDYETALSYLKQSLSIRQEIGDKSGEGTTLNNISQIYDARGDYETALSYLKQSLSIMQEIGDKSGEGTTLNNISQIYDARGDYETALSYLKQSLSIRQEIGDKSGEGTTLNNISQIFKARGDYETALSYLKQSLSIMQEIGDKSGEGTTLNNISLIFNARGDYETALSYLKQSLSIMQEIGDKSGEGTTLNNISQIFNARGDYETALSYLKQSLSIRQEIGDKSGEGTTLNNISQIFKARGDYETALSYLKQSLSIMQEIGDKSGEGTTLNNISQIFKARGDYETALSYLKQSLSIMQEIGDKSGEGTTLNNISQIYDARGDYETALSYLKQSLSIMQEIGDKSGEGTTLNNISQIYDARGDYETALSYLKQSLSIRQEIGDKSGEGTTLNNISQIYDARRDYETALSYLKRSLSIRQEIGDSAGLSVSLLNIGHIYMQKEELEKALTHWIAAYRLAKKTGLAQILDALEKLAENIELPDGMAGWKRLAFDDAPESTGQSGNT